MTIRDQKTGALLDVEDDGRRVTVELPGGEFECCISDSELCQGHDGVTAPQASVTFDKAELLALLGGGK